MKNGNVLLYNSTSNANSAFYVNFRYDSTTALSTQTINGDVITATVIWCSTGTSSYLNVVDIDGVTQTVNWVGGSAPSDGWVVINLIFTLSQCLILVLVGPFFTTKQNVHRGEV